LLFTYKSNINLTTLACDSFIVKVLLDFSYPKGATEAIINEEIFNKVQVIAKKRHNPRVHKSKTLRNPLAGIIKCGGCGTTMTIRTNKNKLDTIRCYKNCGLVKSSYIYLIEERLLHIVLEELKKLKYEFKYKKDDTNNDIEINVLNRTLLTKNKELITINQQKNTLYDLLEQGVYNNSTFLERMNTLSSKIDSINQDIEDIQNKLSIFHKNQHLEKNTLPLINKTIESIENIYWKFDVKQKNEFLRTIVDKVVYRKEKDASRDDFELEVYLKKYI